MLPPLFGDEIPQTKLKEWYLLDFQLTAFLSFHIAEIHAASSDEFERQLIKCGEGLAHSIREAGLDSVLDTTWIQSYLKAVAQRIYEYAQGIPVGDFAFVGKHIVREGLSVKLAVRCRTDPVLKEAVDYVLSSDTVTRLTFAEWTP